MIVWQKLYRCPEERDEDGLPISKAIVGLFSSDK